MFSSSDIWGRHNCFRFRKHPSSLYWVLTQLFSFVLSYSYFSLLINTRVYLYILLCLFNFNLQKINDEMFCYYPTFLNIILLYFSMVMPITFHKNSSCFLLSVNELYKKIIVRKFLKLLIHSSVYFHSPPVSAVLLCSCDKVDHKQEVRFSLYLLGQIVT